MPSRSGGRPKYVLWLFIALLIGAASNIPSRPQVQASLVAQEAPSTAQPPQIGPPPSPAAPHEVEEEGHTDPFSFILLELAAIIGFALFGRWLAVKVNQPSVLGELIVGVIVGNIGFWLGSPLFILLMQMGNAGPLFSQVFVSGASVMEAATRVFKPEELAAGEVGNQVVQILTSAAGPRFVVMAFALWLFSNLGVILLLFMVGLESRVDEMLKVGPRAAMVAVVGVVVPFFLGYGVSSWLLPESRTSVHLFLGATLCATSVGITARVFKDLNRLQSREAKVILGAAVIDDILGLIILAVVVGIVATGEVHLVEIGRISLMSVIYLGAVVLLGERFVRKVVPLVSALDRHHIKLLFPLTLAFAMSWLANQIELATIVGAFAAGLILNEEHFEKHSPNNVTMKEMISPLETIFAPIFFVLMGMQVNLETFLDPGTLGLAAAFIAAAILGKLVAGLPAGKGRDRLSVGIGMVPRGEVGLIFASVGKGLNVVSDSVFSAVVLMVIVTTLITPLALKWSMFRHEPIRQS